MKAILVFLILLGYVRCEEKAMTPKQERALERFNGQYDSLYKWHSFHGADSVKAVIRMKKNLKLL